jgi:hypothetical protein
MSRLLAWIVFATYACALVVVIWWAALRYRLLPIIEGQAG